MNKEKFHKFFYHIKYMIPHYANWLPLSIMLKVGLIRRWYKKLFDKKNHSNEIASTLFVNNIFVHNPFNTFS